jgi:hypothetical protein
MAQPFDTKRLITTGEAVPVAEQVQGVLNSGRVGVFTVSESGLLVYREGAGASGAFLTWFDRSGKQGTAVGDTALLNEFRFSPDRQRVAVAVRDRAGFDVWIYDVSRGRRTRLTFDAAPDRSPVWSPDGSRIVFTSNRKGRFDLYRKAVDSVSAEELLYEDDLTRPHERPRRNGCRASINSKTGRDLGSALTSGGLAHPEPPLCWTTFSEVDRITDGQWILWLSESQRNDLRDTVSAVAFGSGGKLQISTWCWHPSMARRWPRDLLRESGSAVDGR